MNFVALCSNTHICSKTRVLPAFTQVYFLSLFLHPVSPGLTFLGWKTPPLIAAEDDDDFWSMIVSSLASITYPEEQAKNIESRCLYVCIYIYINLLAWVCAALCVTVCVRVCLGECGVPVNTLLSKRFLCRSMANRRHLHFRILIPLFSSKFSTSLYFPFTYSHPSSESAVLCFALFTHGFLRPLLLLLLVFLFFFLALPPSCP